MIWEAIRSGMERQHIKSIVDLSRQTGIGESTLTHTRRSNPNSFTLAEILQLNKTLCFTPAEWEVIRK